MPGDPSSIRCRPMSQPSPYRCEINGSPADADALRLLVSTNYGHFSSMQVQARRVRGWSLHLQRLDAATRELFGHPLPAARISELVRHALLDEQPCSLRINVFSRQLDRENPARPAQPDVLVVAGPAAAASSKPLRLRSFVYQRCLPHIKHVGTFPLFHYRRLAQLDGYDDALFVDADGVVAEGSVWNIGWCKADQVTWPDGPMLRGTAMQLIDSGMTRHAAPPRTRTVNLSELADLGTPFATNSSTPVRRIGSIDDFEFAGSDATLSAVGAAYASNPWEAV
jgi:branched-subunit amino acid aminotransferase/4-amino-4-deoxychorismate lyase